MSCDCSLLLLQEIKEEKRGLGGHQDVFTLCLLNLKYINTEVIHNSI